MTDIASYLNLLFATIGEPHCPRTGEPTPSRTASQILEAILSLPEGAEIELRAPVFKVYGEDLDFVFTEVRKKGCRRLIIDGKPVDISRRGRRSTSRTCSDMDAVVDRFIVEPQAREGDQGGHRRDAARRRRAAAGPRRSRARARPKPSASTRRSCSPTHHFVYGDIGPEFFMFNNPESACRTCGGLGVDKLTHPELLVPDPQRSIRGGCFVREAFKYNPDTWDGRMMFSLSQALDFSLDTPWKELPETGAPRDPLRHRAAEDRDPSRRPTRRSSASDWEGREVGFDGIARRIERYYRRYRQRGEANSRDGGVARQGDGRAHLPRLQRRAPARHAAALHHRRQDDLRRRAAATSTSCTPSSARSSRPAAAPMPAGRC